MLSRKDRVSEMSQGLSHPPFPLCTAAFGSLGASTPMQSVIAHGPIGMEAAPCARFVFRYRPLGTQPMSICIAPCTSNLWLLCIELLRANGVAPLASKTENPRKRGNEAQDPANAPGPSNPKRKRQDPTVKSESQDDEDEEDEDEHSLEVSLSIHCLRTARISH